MSVRDVILTQIRQIADQQGKPLAPLHDDLKLLDSGLDSLCVALVVANLEDELGLDPFGTGDEVKIPVTVGDLIQLYESPTA